MNDIFVSNLPGGDVRKTLESSVRKTVRAAGIKSEFVLKVANVEMDMRGLIKTRVEWLRFTDSRVHKRVVDLLNGRPFEFNVETCAISLKINDRQPNEFHSLRLDPVSTPHPTGQDVRELQYKLDLANKHIEVLNKDKVISAHSLKVHMPS